MSVYFATSCGIVKVGYSCDPFSRVGTITRNGERPDSIPFDAPADLIGYIPGGIARERSLHRKFADRWVAGEWFDLDVTEIRELVWADPHGVDISRMSAMAVFAARKYPTLTRDQLASAGIPVEAPPNAEGLVDALLTFGRAS